jgi:hypothetical protein
VSEFDDGSGVPLSDRMQSLLARAAEDQLSEQRHLADALGDVRAQLAQITGDVAALREQVGQGGGVDDAVGSVSHEVREAVRLIGERLDGLARMVHQRGLDIAELRGSFGELKTSVVAHGDALSGLTGGMDSIPSYGERVAALQETVAALSDRLGGLDEVRAAVADVDSRVGATADSLIDLRRTLLDLRAQVDSLAAVGDLQATALSVAALAERIEAFGAATAPLAEGMAGMQESLRLEIERNARLSQQLGELGDQVEAVAASQHELRADGDALGQRLDGMQNDLTAIGGNVAGLVESGIDPADLTSALDAARAAAEQADRMSEIAVQVADVRAALVGAEGLEAQVATLSQQLAEVDRGDDAGLDERIQTVVSAAVADSERRLSDHLDEAVLALAEVLLRRRPGRVGSALGRGGATPSLGSAAPPAAVSASPVAEAPVVDAPVVDPVDPVDAGSVDEAAGFGTGWVDPGSEPVGGLVTDLTPAAGDDLTDGFDAEADADDASSDLASPDAWDDHADDGDDADEGDVDGDVDDDEIVAGGGDAGPGEGYADWSPGIAAGAPPADLHLDDLGAEAEFGGPVDLEDDGPDLDFTPGAEQEEDSHDFGFDEESGDPHGEPDDADPEREPAMAEAAPSEWTATVTSEVTVEPPKRRRRPWWRPGD